MPQNTPTIGIVVQARMGSTRLPGKMSRELLPGVSVLKFLLRRLSKSIDNPIIVATSECSRDDTIVSIAHEVGLQCFRGSESNVLMRFVQAAEHFHFKRVVRICADNPLLDITSVRHLLLECKQSDSDYIGFRTSNGVPSIKTHFGLWAECVSTDALKRVLLSKVDCQYLEHVTNYIYENPQQFKVTWLDIPSDFKHLGGQVRFTLDTEADLENIKALIHALPDEWSLGELLAETLNKPRLVERMKNEIDSNKK